jgi:arylsulfatase A-like enzyme
LFATLDARIGEHQWAVVLTSDHGATPLIERSASKSARRIPTKEIEDAAQNAIEAEAQAPGPWVVKIVTNNVSLTAKFGDLPTDVKLRSLEAAARSMAAVPGIGGAVRTDLVDPDCKGEREIERVVCHAVVKGEAGELFVWPDRGSVITNNTFGSGHDSPSEDNRRVPIVVMAPGVSPQRASGTILQIAPTIAALLGVDPPGAAKATPLFGIRKR